MHQVQDQMTVFSFREGIFMYTRPLSSCQLRFNAIVVQHHFVVSGCRFLCGMIEARTVTLFRMVRPSGIQFYIADSRHQQYISQVGMSRTAEVGVTETYDGFIPILVTGTIFIRILLISSIHIMWNCVCVRTQLYPSERGASTGEGMPHSVCPDNRIYIIYRLLSYGGQGYRRHSHHQYFLFHLIHTCSYLLTCYHERRNRGSRIR